MPTHLQFICILARIPCFAVQVDVEALFSALTTRAIDAVGERIVKQLSAAAASESRDALAKSLYSRLFDWLVAAVNRKISALGKGDRNSLGALHSLLPDQAPQLVHSSVRAI